MTQRKGFTLVEIMIVVAIIALLAAIAIPSFMKSRADSRKSACINNLRLLDHAKQQLATSSQTMTDDYTPAMSELVPYFKGMSNTGRPVCRDGGSYSINAISNNPTCSMTAKGHILTNDVN
jgi:prepilin-type N-terminal cleavage/methylation domain-containing protein